MYTEDACERRWTRLVAPRTGSISADLVDDLSRYLKTSPAAIADQLENATERFTSEWRDKVPNPSDERAVVRFYNESTTELFDLAQWHSSDRIHYRTLMCIDIARERTGRQVLDYGCGIGSDSLALAASGFEVTMADVSSSLQGFAAWRCRERGFDVRVLDLKRERLPRRAFDAVVCFDVLEHVPRPFRAVRAVFESMKTNGLLFVHAPFGADPERPMHLIHEDILTPRMRVAGFHWREDLQHRFPTWLWSPKVYEAMDVRFVDRCGYYLHDIVLPNRVGEMMAGVYRSVITRRGTPM